MENGFLGASQIGTDRKCTCRNCHGWAQMEHVASMSQEECLRSVDRQHRDGVHLLCLPCCLSEHDGFPSLSAMAHEAAGVGGQHWLDPGHEAGEMLQGAVSGVPVHCSCGEMLQGAVSGVPVHCGCGFESTAQTLCEVNQTQLQSWPAAQLGGMPGVSMYCCCGFEEAARLW
eukprot:evm.model.scf_28.11 EVM.evm.TU.scf_28.11   scf_28:198149-198664(-)